MDDPTKSSTDRSENLQNHPDSNAKTKPDDSKEGPKPTRVEPKIFRPHRELPWAWEPHVNPIFDYEREMQMNANVEFEDYENEFEDVDEHDEVQPTRVILEPLPRKSNKKKSSNENSKSNPKTNQTSIGTTTSTSTGPTVTEEEHLEQQQHPLKQ